MKNSTRFVANLAKWSRGMIRALGARGPGFESPFGPHILLTAKTILARVIFLHFQNVHWTPV